MSDQVYRPPQGPPRHSIPQGIYQAMGEAPLFAMLDAVYQELGASPISHLFPQGAAALKRASEKSAAFFVQILGGPRLYSDQYGPPKMRARHLAFAIDEQAKEHWLRCFFSVLEEAPERFGFPEKDMAAFKGWLGEFAAWMVNVAPA